MCRVAVRKVKKDHNFIFLKKRDALQHRLVIQKNRILIHRKIFQGAEMKNKKGHQHVSDLKRKIKSLQDQVTTQGEMIHNMADQISELMCARKRDESGMAKLTNSSTAEVDIDTICGVVRRMQKDVSEMKDQHVKCKNVHKKNR